MSDVTFDEGTNVSNNNNNEEFMRRSAPKQPSIVRLLIKMGLAKTERGANVIMIITSIISLTIAGYLMFGQQLFQRQHVTYLEDIPEEIRKTLPEEILKTIPSRANPQ
jgi:hypothetical protein